MANVLLVQPWDYHDEGKCSFDHAHSWRNGPLNLLQLAAQLNKNGHHASIVDMKRDLVLYKGDLHLCFRKLIEQAQTLIPDIIGISFCSVNYIEAQKIVKFLRKSFSNAENIPLLVGGGIHCSLEPDNTLKQIEFDAVFIGEAELGIVEIANGNRLDEIEGVYLQGSKNKTAGVQVKNLDELEYPGWELCDFNFYSHPSYARLKIRKTSSLDLMMGRGCCYSCNFCAYSALSKLRYHSSDYIVDQIKYMIKKFNIDGFYFIDSTIGSNKKLLTDFCEKMIKIGLSNKIKWLGNMRVDQISEELLKLMWKAGCRYLFYGFESGSQRMLDKMGKKTTVQQNIKVAMMHNQMGFPYNASMIFGYPGETEDDVKKTLSFLRKVMPPSIGINCFVPLPGSYEYSKLKAEGKIQFNDSNEWRLIGEVNPNRIYSELPTNRFNELYKEALHMANSVIPNEIAQSWR